MRGVLNGSDIEAPKGKGFRIKKGYVPESPIDNTPKSTQNFRMLESESRQQQNEAKYKITKAQVSFDMAVGSYSSND